MLFKELGVGGVFLIEPERRVDERGYFARLFCADELRRQGLVSSFVQVNTAFSPRAGTLRGMHFQESPHAEVKVARCLRGAVFDVALDLRGDSATYGRWAGAELSADNGAMLYVPEGCAHGYVTLVPDTELMYFTSRTYAPSAARGVRFDDPLFGVHWPMKPNLISQADSSWPYFEVSRASRPQ